MDLGRVLVVTIALAAACTTADKKASGPCPHAGDGVCDEPYDCPVGSDAIDCAAACAKDPESAPIACAMRGHVLPSAPSAVPPPVGSRGSGGPAGTWDGSIKARGRDPSDVVDRFFRVRVPARYDPAVPAPLLYVLGGYRSSMYDLAGYTEIERTSDQNGFIVAYLEAYWHGNMQAGYVWDWFVYPQQWTGGGWEANPDADFISKLTARLGALYDVDRTRVFMSGHSRGGAESIIIAHTLTGVIAGYCSESGFVTPNGADQLVKNHPGPRKVPGVFIHGRLDTDVTFKEAKALEAALIARGDVEGEDYLFFDLPNVTHRWQPALNQPFWDFLYAHPLPKEMLAP